MKARTKEQKYFEALALFVEREYERTYDWKEIEETLKENGLTEDELEDIRMEIGLELDEEAEFIDEMKDIESREAKEKEVEDEELRAIMFLSGTSVEKNNNKKENIVDDILEGI